MYRGEWRGQEVAVKVVKVSFKSPRGVLIYKNQGGGQAAEEFNHEVRTLEIMRCPQVVLFVSTSFYLLRLCTLLELFVYLANLQLLLFGVLLQN